jgi:hypothetical protein
VPAVDAFIDEEWRQSHAYCHHVSGVFEGSNFGNHRSMRSRLQLGAAHLSLRTRRAEPPGLYR